MAIRIQDCTKSFMTAGRRRKPLYRDLLSIGSRHKRQNSTVVLRDICLDIPNGSKVAVIGANGAGKTTLLRMIAGIYKPDCGALSVEGRVCCYFESGAGMAPSLPVRDNAFLFAALAGLNHQETKSSLTRILEFAALTEQEYTWVEHLSFGMQQRLFLSILLEVMRLGRAEVFLFDEFLIGVDREFRKTVEAALTAFTCTDQIILHASHDHELMLRTCPQAILVLNGGIRHFGPTEEVLDLYQRT